MVRDVMWDLGPKPLDAAQFHPASDLATIGIAIKSTSASHTVAELETQGPTLFFDHYEKVCETARWQDTTVRCMMEVNKFSRQYAAKTLVKLHEADKDRATLNKDLNAVTTRNREFYTRIHDAGVTITGLQKDLDALTVSQRHAEMVESLTHCLEQSVRDMRAAIGSPGAYTGRSEALVTATASKLQEAIREVEEARQLIYAKEHEIVEGYADLKEMRAQADGDIAEAKHINEETKRIKRLHVKQVILDPDFFPEEHAVATQKDSALTAQHVEEVFEDAYRQAFKSLVTRGDHMQGDHELMVTHQAMSRLALGDPACSIRYYDPFSEDGSMKQDSKYCQGYQVADWAIVRLRYVPTRCVLKISC
jgi:hypothetical protein